MSKTGFPFYPTSMLDEKKWDIFRNVGTYLIKMSKTDFSFLPTSLLDEKNDTFFSNVGPTIKC